MAKETVNQNNPKEPATKMHKALTIVGIVLCVILIPMLIINCTLIVKSFVNEDEVPSIGGVFPLIVLTDSMAPEIKSGDIIRCKQTDADSIKVGDDISFFDPAGNGSSIVTHRVIEIVDEDGQRFFRTKGINNNTEDRVLVPTDKLVGIYAGVRLAGAGHIALFMQTTPGLIVCVVLPVILLVGYDMIRRRLYEKRKGNDMQNLMAELEALKAAAAAQAAAEAPTEEAPIEETPTEEAPVVAPIEEAPTEEAPAEETPVEDSTVE
jgi:signal peptidase